VEGGSASILAINKVEFNVQSVKVLFHYHMVFPPTGIKSSF
jgi:hypothetical protein